MENNKGLIDEFEKLQSSKLGVSESHALVALEKVTDDAITEQFWKNRQVNIDDNLIEAIVRPFGTWRAEVLTTAWKKLYQEGGWIIQYNDNQACYWSLTSRQK